MHVVTVVYRGMIEDADGAPAVGRAGNLLGVRDTDIDVTESGDVLPGSGGMSVAPDDPRRLPRHRRPREFEGTADHPAWGLTLSDLPADLGYRPDPRDPSLHGYIEPSAPMPVERYEDALASTRSAWTKAIP